MGEQEFGPFELNKGEHTFKLEFLGNGFYFDALGIFGDIEEVPDNDSTNSGYDEGVIVR